MKFGVYIIHSITAKDRTPNVEALEAFFRNKVAVIKRVDGVYTDTPYADSRYDHTHKLKKGVVGCALAHVNAMKQALSDNVDYALIFEDDVGICCDSSDVVLEWLSLLEKEIPDWSIGLMYYLPPFVGKGDDGTIHTSRIENAYFRIMTCPYGTQAYCVKKTMLEWLLSVQENYMKQGKLAIADGLFIYERQKDKTFFKLVGPVYNEMFFTHLEIPSLIGIH